MAPKKQYVYAITRRDFEDGDKKGTLSLLEIHATVDSANAAALDASGDDQDETSESQTKDLCVTYKNKTQNFTIVVKKTELKDDTDGNGQGGASVASAVSSTAKSGTKKAPAKKAPGATKKTTMLQGEPDSLQGLKLIFTGSLSMDRTTCDLTAKAHGAEIVSAANMDEADYVVLGNKPGEKKLADIKDKGLSTLTEEEFVEMLNQPASKKRKV
ncbi:uncharacterized protein RCC_09679 [Ramularia collo-cygni]|uniref:BRCT domain-containing protein n=1 Tax=Ramularia collo-cygni TaxID=112498 RepID=A0A2D3V7J6_9PEZI|nr:uncharacterized protein RCC_09679 [Ramularia collo-cygni]CZT23963.1 uncharacterized protein RCC_09679 [Ramularia collo-cygni]